MSGQTPSVPSYYQLTYHYVDNIVEKRGPHREGHLNAIKKMHGDGKVLAGGAYGSPPKGATIIFKDCSEADVAKFVKDDPYYANELVKTYTIEPYALVVGE